MADDRSYVGLFTEAQLSCSFLYGVQRRLQMAWKGEKDRQWSLTSRSRKPQYGLASVSPSNGGLEILSWDRAKLQQ